VEGKEVEELSWGETRMKPSSSTPLHRKSLIHVIADCTVCGKHWENYLTAQKLAAAHARRTGHRVIAELGYVIEYGRKP